MRKIGSYIINTVSIKDAGRNAILATFKDIYEKDDGTRGYKPRLQIFDDPQRPFYVTAPQYQDYQYGKDFEFKDRLIEYMCPDSELNEKLAQVLGVRGFRAKSLTMLCDSPYVYGANISAETIIKQRCMAQAPEGIPPITVGGLDIENEIDGEGRINLITYIHEHKIYTAGLKAYTRTHLGNDKFQSANIEDVEKEIQYWVGDLIGQHNFSLEAKIFESELDMIKWIFEKIHENKTDFINIWNINHDIPKILSRIEALGGNVEQIICHPDVPHAFKYVNYKEDKKNVDHIADKWHWFSAAGYSQCIDAMCLYARLRAQSDGRDSSYTLDYISHKELKLRKLHFDGIESFNHKTEQRYHFLRYWAYNVNDVLLLILMEFKNTDTNKLYSLSTESPFSLFASSTRRMTDSAYKFGQEHGKIPKAVGRSGYTEFDNYIENTGGTVLPMEKADRTGIPSLSDGNWETLVSLLCNDLDVTSFYPSTIAALNEGKDSCLATVLGIENYPFSQIDHAFRCAIDPKTSALDFCQTYLGFYNYEEMDNAFVEHLNNPTN